MHPGVPLATSPAQSQIDAVLGTATRAEVIVRGERVRVLAAEDLRALGRVLRIAPGAPGWTRDPPGSIEVWPWGGGEELGVLLLHADLSVRWVTWDAACGVEDPAALGEWLSARGQPEPLANLHVRASAEAPQRRARFLELAPAALKPRLGELERDPHAFEIPTYREAFDALAEALGGADSAVWAIGAWYGAAPGPWDRALPVERLPDGLLRSFGVDLVIDAAARGVPESARAGLCRFLVENARSRGWDLAGRLPKDERRALVRAAHTAGEPSDEARATAALIDEGPLAPEGSRLVGVAKNGALRRLCTDGTRAFALDLRDVTRFDKTGESRVLTEVYRPDTPLAARGKDLWFLNPLLPNSVPGGGGDVRERRAPFLALPEARFGWSNRRFREACDRAVERALPGADPNLVLDVDRDERDAYVAFGGDLPSAIAASHFWACDAKDPRLLRISRGGESRALAVPGRPVAIGAQGDRVHVVTDHGDGSVSVVVVGRDLSLLATRRCVVRSEQVRGVLLVGDDVWLRLAAPLGDVLVVLAG